MKRLLSIFALLLFASVANAQITGPQNVKAGDLVHLTIAAPDGSDVIFEMIEPNDIDFVEFKADTRHI